MLEQRLRYSQLQLAKYLVQGDGCESITDEMLCVHSRDGMAHDFFGSVRVGKACAWHKRGICERVDEWMRKRENPSQSPKTLWDKDACLASVDDSPSQQIAGKVCGFCKVQVAKMALPVYKNCTGYCRAQGLTCSKAFKGHLHSCDVESPMGCDEAFGTETAPLCECQPAAIKEQMKCLKAEEKGCFGITDRINCLSQNPSTSFSSNCATPGVLKEFCNASCFDSFGCCACLGSKDGTTEVGKAGFKIGGEPCVWCGDGPGPWGRSIKDPIASLPHVDPLSSSAKVLHN
eukprot:Skav201530  [mRNA]  locus=scaffold1616:25331:38965:+ [translate_table: standard]